MSEFEARHYDNESHVFKILESAYPSNTYIKCGGNNSVRIDGLVAHQGKLVGVFEYKHRERPFEYFQRFGTFVLDEDKYLYLGRMSQEFEVKAFIFVETSDALLFELELFDCGKKCLNLDVESINVWKSSLKKERITKNLVHLPINKMNFIKG